LTLSLTLASSLTLSSCKRQIEKRLHDFSVAKRASVNFSEKVPFWQKTLAENTRFQI
jgi:hypothetical protein